MQGRQQSFCQNSSKLKMDLGHLAVSAMFLPCIMVEGMYLNKHFLPYSNVCFSTMYIKPNSFVMVSLLWMIIFVEVSSIWIGMGVNMLLSNIHVH